MKVDERTVQMALEVWRTSGYQCGLFSEEMLENMRLALDREIVEAQSKVDTLKKALKDKGIDPDPVG